MIDYYQLLNISPDATEAEIKKAIRQQRAKFRRRVDSSPDIDTRSMAEKKVEQIGEAEKILTDPEKREAYDQQLESAPPDTSADQPTGSRSKDWLAVASQYYKNGDLRKAYAAAKEATDVQSNNVRAWTLRAMFASDLDNYDDADFAIDQGMGIDPKYPVLHSVAASVAYDQKKYDTAIAEYREAFLLDPTDYSDAIQISYVMADAGRRDEGYNHLKSLHEINPDNEEITMRFVEYALIQLGRVLSDSNGKFPTLVVPTNKVQVKVGVEIMKDIESLDVNNEGLRQDRQQYKEALDYAKQRNFEKIRVFTVIAIFLFWSLMMMILNNLFHGFAHFLFVVLGFGLFALIVYLVLFPYGYQMNKEKVGESAARTGLQDD